MTFFAFIKFGFAAVLATGILAVPAGAAAQNRPILQFGSSGAAVASLQKRLHIPNDGVFGKQTLGNVLKLQAGKGLTPDGVVGPRTWRFVLNPGKPASGEPFRGTGHRRAVLDKKNNVVFLIRSNGSVIRRYWTVDNDAITPTGSMNTEGRAYRTSNFKSENSTKPGNLWLYYFTWINRTRGIGFHAIPRDKKTGHPIHSESELGAGTAQSSHGCVRLSPSAAKFLYDWLPTGAAVRVVSSM